MELDLLDAFIFLLLKEYKVVIYSTVYISIVLKFKMQPSFLFDLQHSLLVHQVDLRSVHLLCLVALDLHCVGHYSFHQEGGWLEVYVFGLLETLKPGFLSDFVQVVDHLSSYLIIFAQLLKIAFNSLACG